MKENRLEEALSLPPLLNDSIQGRLDFIILRPILVPPLQPNQALTFKFSWWGSDYVHSVSLNSEEEELKIVFNIRCDFQGLQRYFQDAKELEIFVYVSDCTPDASSSNTQKTENIASQLKYTMYQLRKKKEWTHGDYVGSFTITNLKLNARGEYVCECNVFNPYGDQCGSIVVFILHTTQKNKTLVSTKEVSYPSVIGARREIRVPERGKSLNNQAKAATKPCLTPKKKSLEAKPNLSLTPKKNSLEAKPIKSRDDLSPRFIPFKGRNVTPLKNKTNTTKIRDHPNLKQSPKRSVDLATSPKNQPVVHYNPPKSGQSSTKEVVPSEPKDVLPSSYILTRLFSFVDSGAIHSTDLPTLIQICQGRSPSIELDVSSPQNSYMLSCVKDISKPYYDEPCVPPSEPMDQKRGGYSMLKKSKRTVSFSGISYHSDSGSVECPEVTRIFDDDFLNSLSLSRKINEEKCLDSINRPTKSSQTSNSVESQKSLEEKNIEDVPHKVEETSLLILKFDSIQFSNQNIEEEFEKIPKECFYKQTNKRAVRQRSKVCYFVEVSLEFEEEEDRPQSLLYISRRLGNKEVLFGISRIFRLPAFKTPQNCRGFLKFRVSRRRLGNRLRELVGVGVVALEQVHTDSEGEVCVVLPLWIPTKGSEAPIKTRSISEALEVPLGALKFSVTFALTSLSEEEDNFNQGLGLGANEGQTDHDRYSNTQRRSEIDINSPRFDDAPKGELDHGCHPQKPLETKEESLIVETGSSLHFVPARGAEVPADTPDKEVHLEIVEGNGLPRLRSKDTGLTFPPSAYVQTTLPSMSFSTTIPGRTSTPKWNHSTDFKLRPDHLEHTNFNLILKVFHSLKGTEPHPDDPLLGFAAIDTRFLWNSFVSLCGWIPVLNLDGETCGEIKVSLTPKRPSTLPRNSSLKDITNHSFHRHDIEQAAVSNRPVQFAPKSPDLNGRNKSSEITREFHPRIALTESEFCHRPEGRPRSPVKDLIGYRSTGDLQIGHERRPLADATLPLALTEPEFPSNTGESETSTGSDLIRGERNAFISSPDGSLIPSALAKGLNSICLNPTQSVPASKNSYEHFNAEEASFDKGPNILREEESKPTLNARPPLPPADRSLNPNKTNSNPLKQPNLVFEGLQWMNQLGSCDTPCVSYLDIDHVVKTSKENLNDKPAGHSVPAKPRPTVRRKRSRLAANLNFT